MGVWVSYKCWGWKLVTEVDGLKCRIEVDRNWRVTEVLQRPRGREEQREAVCLNCEAEKRMVWRRGG